MLHNFMLFSELQKKVSPSPIKTWRLLDRMRTEGRMKEGEDFMMVDRKLHVNVPRFVVEMEHMGYSVKSDDIKNGNVADEINKLYEELRLISDEMTERRIEEEMKSDDIRNDKKTDGHAVAEPIINEHTPPFSVITAGMKSGEITQEELVRKSDGISPTMITPEINLKLPEFNLLLQGKDEIIGSKKEQIEDMKAMYTEILASKDKMLTSKDDELKEVRTALDTVVKQNETLVHQNVFLTRLLTSPKEDHSRPHEDVISPDFKDVTDVMPEPVPTAAHEPPTATDGTHAPPQTTPDTHLASDHLDGNPAAPENPVAHA